MQQQKVTTSTETIKADKINTRIRSSGPRVMRWRHTAMCYHVPFLTRVEWAVQVKSASLSGDITSSALTSMFYEIEDCIRNVISIDRACRIR